MTDIQTFIRPIRVLLNDNDPDAIYAVENQQLLDAIVTVLEFGRVPGYAFDPDYRTVTPDLIPSQDAVSYTRLCLHAARLFVIGITRTSFNTRAFSETIGQPFELVDAIINDVYQLDNGDQCL